MQTQSANVLFGDIKGYSGLDENQLRRFAEDILPMAAQRISNFEFFHVNTWGDGIIIASDSVQEIARISVELRDFFSHQDWNKFDLPPLDIRLSVHHGEFRKGIDPFTQGGLLSGRSIILAARIEPITMPGRIWITETAALMLRQAEKGAKAPHFAADEIGVISLPKGAGEEKIFLLRRAKEAALSDEERSEILSASQRRRDGTEGKQAVTGDQFEVCIGIVVHQGNVLMVRRNPDDTGLGWMFPSGKRRPVDDKKYVVVKEVKQETGISCICLEKIADVDCHPLTGALCHFYHLRPLDDAEPHNVDAIENLEVRYVPVGEVPKLIGEHLTPDVAAFLARHLP